MIWIAFAAGLAAGVSFGAWFAWERFLRYECRPVEVKVTPELYKQIEAEAVRGWLDLRGLVVMPKGKEFTWPGESHR